MRPSRFNEEQIIAILREQEAGAATADVCRKHGISGATFYKWKAKYGGIEVSDARQLKALDDENRRLKKLLAEAMLDNAMLKDIAAKNGDARRQTRGRGSSVPDAWSEPAACRVLGADAPRSATAAEGRTMARSGLACASSPAFAAVSDTDASTSCSAEGTHMNHKKLRRLYAEERLQVRRRGGRKRALGTRAPMAIPQGPNRRWSLDFLSDALADGRRFRIFAVVDDFTRECLCLVIGGGVIGASIAWHAAERGLGDVILLERDRLEEPPGLLLSALGHAERPGAILASISTDFHSWVRHGPPFRLDRCRAPTHHGPFGYLQCSLR